MRRDVIWKFQNREVYIFEKYFKLSAFDIERNADSIVYNYEIEDDYREFFVIVTIPTLEHKAIGFSEKEVVCGYKDADGNEHHDSIAINLLRDLANFYTEEEKH